MKAIFLGFVLCVFAGCSQQSPPEIAKLDANATRLVDQEAEPLAQSLFKADQAVLSNADIERIFAARIYPPAHGRIAAVRVGARNTSRWGWWSEQVEQMDQKVLNDLLSTLRSNPRVSDAFVLPTLLQPAQATIPYLRESAARVQADSLLIYRTFSQTYQKQRVFGNDEVRAYCTAEAVLLDTRSGIITFTDIVTEPFAAHKTQKELSFEETIVLAEQEATARALKRIGQNAQRFLNEAPIPRQSETKPSDR